MRRRLKLSYSSSVSSPSSPPMEARKEEPAASTSWKLYDNPFYDHRRRPNRRQRRRSAVNESTAVSELRLAYAQIEEMKAELETERTLRKRAEEILNSQREMKTSQRAAESSPAPPLRSSSQRRESPENPHIKRAMKGYVEFPRGLRGRREAEEGGAARVDCQMAQLRVLLKGRSPPVSSSSRLDLLLA